MSKSPLSKLHDEYLKVITLPDKERAHRHYAAMANYRKVELFLAETTALLAVATKRLHDSKLPNADKLAALRLEYDKYRADKLCCSPRNKNRLVALKETGKLIRTKMLRLSNSRSAKLLPLRRLHAKLTAKHGILTRAKHEASCEIIRTQGDKFVKVLDRYYDPSYSPRTGIVYLVPHDQVQPAEVRARKSVRERAKRERARARAGKGTYYVSKGVRMGGKK